MIADQQAKRFVVQEHRRPGESPHYDLMFEREGTLATWSFRLPPWEAPDIGRPGDPFAPRARSVQKRPERSWRFEPVVPATGASTQDRPAHACERLAGHRMRYLEFEGDIGGGRGTVHIVDAGQYVPATWSTDEVVVTFQGRRLSGLFRLTCAKTQSTT
ncbi:MAG: DNA polymerase ligase N-terminal domain-containing protein [Planctomycetota bacterium]|nr:DNA polymerase ligase N-terminal domain-containing protein [Planctomycetota bacterium]